jgi:hypothetical protein
VVRSLGTTPKRRSARLEMASRLEPKSEVRSPATLRNAATEDGKSKRGAAWVMKVRASGLAVEGAGV